MKEQTKLETTTTIIRVGNIVKKASEWMNGAEKIDQKGEKLKNGMQLENKLLCGVCGG